MKKEKITKYFAPWDGWSCLVEDENEDICGEVIECDTGSLIVHLKEKHNINVNLE